MNKNSETIKSLNDLLAGEYMAVESFNTLIFNLENNSSKNIFQDVQKQHRQNIDVLANHIQNIGGKPHENLGLKGKMGKMKLKMDLGKTITDQELIEKAIEGETEGINMAEKILRGNLDNKSRVLAGEILQKDRNAIDKLRIIGSI